MPYTNYDWTCNTCGFRNFSRNKVCNSCYNVWSGSNGNPRAATMQGGIHASHGFGYQRKSTGERGRGNEKGTRTRTQRDAGWQRTPSPYTKYLQYRKEERSATTQATKWWGGNERYPGGWWTEGPGDWWQNDENDDGDDDEYETQGKQKWWKDETEVSSTSNIDRRRIPPTKVSKKSYTLYGLKENVGGTQHMTAHGGRQKRPGKLFKQPRPHCREHRNYHDCEATWRKQKITWTSLRKKYSKLEPSLRPRTKSWTKRRCVQLVFP